MGNMACQEGQPEHEIMSLKPASRVLCEGMLPGGPHLVEYVCELRFRVRESL